MAAIVPAAIAGTSIDTLSVSISNRLSPGFTASPAFTNHFEIVPSATVSPSCGIRTSIHSPVTPRHPGRAKREPGSMTTTLSKSHRSWLWAPAPARVARLAGTTALVSPTHRDVLRLHELQEPLVRPLAPEAG